MTLCASWLSLVLASLILSSTGSAYAEEVPHAKIEGIEIISDELLGKIPKEGAFLRSHLEDMRKSFHIGVMIPEHRAKDGTRFNTAPELQTPGMASFDWEEGRFIKMHAALVDWERCDINKVIPSAVRMRPFKGGEGRRLTMLFTVSYVLPPRTAALVVPVEIHVWRDEAFNYHVVRVDLPLRRLAVATTDASDKPRDD